jgi:protein phosphatase PTC7
LTTQGPADSQEAWYATSADTEAPEASTSPTEGNGVETNNAATESGVPEQLRFRAAAAVIPHPDKVDKGGEDAFFIADDGLAVGVADGVGSWIERNVDPGLYSRMLMEKCKETAASTSVSEDAARQIMVRAHGQVDLLGSSTACVLLLDGSTLRAANIGDSGFMVLRRDPYEERHQITYVSPPQQHSFNFPYQLAGPQCSGDDPQLAQKFELEVKKGDVLIVATDGVSDNVWPQEAAAVVSTIIRRGGPPDVAAAGLANFAQFRSQELDHMTPFAFGAQQAGMTFGGGRPYMGGKPDDITVIVAMVTGASKL